MLLQIVTNNVNGEIYYLYHCGSKPPAVNGKVFEIPLRSVSADDTSGADFIVSAIKHTPEQKCDLLLLAGLLPILSCAETTQSDGPHSLCLRTGSQQLPAKHHRWAVHTAGEPCRRASHSTLTRVDEEDILVTSKLPSYTACYSFTDSEAAVYVK
jgi:hypothetical protein